MEVELSVSEVLRVVLFAEHILQSSLKNARLRPFSRVLQLRNFLSDSFVVEQVLHPIEQFLLLGAIPVLIAMEVLRDVLLVGEFGVFGPSPERLLHFDLLLGLDGVQPDALQVDRKLFEGALAIPPRLVLPLHLVDQLADRYPPNAPLPIDHVRPLLLHGGGRLRAAVDDGV